MPQIRKRGNKYSIIVSCGYIGEKHIQKSCTYTPKAKTPKAIQKEVQAYAYDFENKVKTGNYLDGHTLKFNDVVNEWIHSNEYKRLTKGVQEDYKSRLDLYFLPELQSYKLADIQVKHIQDIVNEMEEKGLKPATIKRALCSISSVLRFAKRMNWIDRNPLDNVIIPSIVRDTKLHYFNLKQAKDFLHALTLEYPHTVKAHDSHNRITKNEQTINEYTTYTTIPYQFQVYFTLALLGGFRRAELIALTWNDINFDNNTIQIKHATGKSKEGQYIKNPKTVASIRKVELPQNCFDMLAEWHEQEKNLADSLGTKWQGKRGKDFDNTFIFIQNDGKQMHLDTPYQRFKEIISSYNSLVENEEDKLPEIRLHDLRHTTATLLIAENVNIATVSKRLGHSQTSVTLNIYTHGLEEKDHEASNTIAKLFSSAT